MQEEPLAGGVTNGGAVVRSGHHVLRPATDHTTGIHAFLRSIRSAGFHGAPLPIGVDNDGRERLEFLEGDVPRSPYPAWSQTERALASIAALLRRLHDASALFDPSGHEWSDVLADPAGGNMICHNDLELSNVVFENGIAIGFIDFEFAAPGRAIYDVAQLARLCVPIEHDVDRARMGWRTGDPATRLRVIADSYGLDDAGRVDLITALDDALTVVEQQARSGDDPINAEAVAKFSAIGGIEKYDRRRLWWRRQRRTLASALR